MSAGFAVVCALLALSACESATATDRFELSGYVQDQTSGRGVGGARVQFVSDTLFEAETQTNGDGFYEMVVETDRPFGQVQATADGYDPEDATVFFDTNRRRLDIRLRAMP